MRAYAQACQLLRRRMCPRRASQTALEYLASLQLADSQFATAEAGVSQLTAIFVLARYRPGPVSGEQVAAARSALAEVRRTLRRKR